MTRQHAGVSLEMLDAERNVANGYGRISPVVGA
jgi:hypothetical protein